MQEINDSLVKSEQEQPEIFTQRFRRSARLLHFLACRICDQERAPIVMQNCWRTASRNPPHFAYAGDFRSWLVRILIDEALAVLREGQVASDMAILVNDVSVFDSTEKTRT